MIACPSSCIALKLCCSGDTQCMFYVENVPVVHITWGGVS